MQTSLEENCESPPNENLDPDRPQVSVQVSSVVASAKGRAAAAGEGISSVRSGGNSQQGAAAAGLALALPAADSCCPSLTIRQRLYGCLGCFVLGGLLGFIGWLEWISDLLPAPAAHPRPCRRHHRYRHGFRCHNTDYQLRAPYAQAHTLKAHVRARCTQA